jgi:sodium-dependent dicarboxylate transporter 2/3/5
VRVLPVANFATDRRLLGRFAGLGLFLIVLLAPPPPGLELPGWRAAAVGLLMAVWWMTEALPIAATSLLPLLLFPLLGILPIRQAAAPYANPLIFLFLGGFLIALAMERWELHRRVALLTIRAVGVRPSRVVAGFMIASAGLSMWISNTATAMMMLPIGLSVVQLVEGRKEDAGDGEPGHGGEEKEGTNFAVCLMLGIAYACSVGGLGTLIGTPPNALFSAYVLETWGVEISFVRWLAVGLPLTAVGLVVVFLVLVRWVFPLRLKELPGGRELIGRELAKLGPMSRAEKRVAAVFALTALLWVTRPLITRVLPGLSDAGVAIFGALSLFLIPAGGQGSKRRRALLDGGAFQRLPWRVLLLFGGGLSLASAIQGTGLAAWIGGRMEALAGWPVAAVALLVVAVIVLLTELTSNTATAATFLPVLGSMALGLGQNPLLLLAPAVLAASCAFMLPVATPPNAIIYGSGQVTIPQMVRAGIWLNILFSLLVTLAAFTLVPLAFGVQVGVVPGWAGR